MDGTFWLLIACVVYRILGDGQGRHTSWRPMRCEDEDCWRGPLRRATHTYQDDGTGADVEAHDECPRCGGELVDVLQEREDKKRAKKKTKEPHK